MKTLLVIAERSGLADAIRAVLDAGRFRVLHQSEPGAAGAVIAQGRVDACVLDAELTTIQPIRTIEQLRRLLPNCPILVYAGARQWEWEEEAYLLGVEHILTKPVRGRLLNNLLERFWPPESRAAGRATPARAAMETKPAELSRPAPQKALEVLRQFSALLPHSLSVDAILKQFLLLLRETVAVNRAAIFLRPSPEALGEVRHADESRRLRSACAIGLPPDLTNYFALSLDTGVGGQISREGRILRRDAAELRDNPEIQKEFELLGAEVALPILDRETLMGVAFFDRRVTGDSLTNEELALVFYMLEGLGMAIKNIWLHQEVAANHEMMGGILRQLNCGCVVVARDLSVQHANQVARDCFIPGRAAGAPLEFNDLPQIIGSKVFQVLNHGAAVAPFKYRPSAADGRVYQLTITPFQMQHRGVPSAALMLVDDCTQAERLQELEVEAANLKLIKIMAERLAHEVGNAIVPLSTHQQLFPQKHLDPDFQASLETALTEGVKRIGRLGRQMLFLAGDRPAPVETVSVSKLIEDAFQEARTYHGHQPVTLQYENGGPPLPVAGDRAGLTHALAEVMLNALQAESPASQVRVRTRREMDVAGAPWVRLEVRDGGAGFTAEAARQGAQPFFSTRNVGLGLGLTVSRKIIEIHHGKIEITEPSGGQPATVTITLPLAHENS